MNEIDIEIIKTQKRLYNLRKLKRLQRKLKCVERSHPYFMFVGLVDCFIDLVRREL